MISSRLDKTLTNFPYLILHFLPNRRMPKTKHKNAILHVPKSHNTTASPFKHHTVTPLLSNPEQLAPMSDKELGAVTRRFASVANHLLPIPPPSIHASSIELCSTSAKKDNYHKIHGQVSDKEVVWRIVKSDDDSGKEFTDIIYEKAVGEGIAKTTINRPERRNAFRPQTVKEMMRALDDARHDSSFGVIILTGKGTKAFCSGGDQTLRNKDGYADKNDVSSLNVLDLQVQIRRLPKPVIAMVAGYAVGGGHILHMVCDLTIAADNAIFGQTGPKIGPKKAREMWFLARFYTADEAEKMGLVNTVVPLDKLEQETVQWCREILRNSPIAVRVLKAAINAVDDGHAGLQQLAGDTTLIFYGTKEGIEGKTAYVQKRSPEFSKFPRRP